MKKVFLILSIVLILFSFVLPCFALTVNYADNLLRPQNGILYNPHYNISVSYSSHFDNLHIEDGHTYFFMYKYYSGEILIEQTYSYFVYFSYNGWRGVTQDEQFSASNFLLTATSDADLQILIRPVRNFVFDLVAFDVTNLNYSSLSELVSAFSFVNDSLLGRHYFDSVSNPLITFYGSIRHVFDFFSDIFNQSSPYYQPFLFLSGSLFICFIIFIVVLVIRRCRNI